MAWIEKYKTKRGIVVRVRYRRHRNAKKTSLTVGPHIESARMLKNKLDVEEFSRWMIQNHEKKIAAFLKDAKWPG